MAWWHHLPGGKRRSPVRVGVLNSGELVIVDDTNCAQVFTSSTTDLIRDVLDASQSIFDAFPPPEPPTEIPVRPQGVVHEFSDI